MGRPRLARRAALVAVLWGWLSWSGQAAHVVEAVQGDASPCVTPAHAVACVFVADSGPESTNTD